MWNLEETERLVLCMLPITAVVAALLLLLMTTSLKPERLSLSFAEATPPSVSVPQR